MPWIIGIDEAGYGPNLGPFVMSAVGCWVPSRQSKSDLWDLLRNFVRRADDESDGRLLVADSKVVYSPARGLADLEKGALVLLQAGSTELPDCLGGYVECVCPSALMELKQEAWFVGDSPLPLSASLDEVSVQLERIRRATSNGVKISFVRSAIICPPTFNSVLDRWNSKGAVLVHGLATLIEQSRAAAGDVDSLHFFIDKHGGRNHYAATLQHALPGTMIVASEESAQCSSYTVLGLKQPCRFQFQPRADSAHFCVAAASMLSKYLRELLMHEFNRFWQNHVPHLKSTAGYPGDAGRFLKDIKPAMQRLGIAESALWRRK
jgi:ribonuclease HII